MKVFAINAASVASSKKKYQHDDFSYKMVGATIHVHKRLGLGCLYKALTLLSKEL